jgi:hypothetical protein
MNTTKPEIQGRYLNLLEIVDRRNGEAQDVAWWGPVVGSDEDVPSDRATAPEPIVRIHSSCIGEVVWWGPVIGADEPSPPPPSGLGHA